MRKFLISVYSFFCLMGLRIRGAHIPFSSYIGPHRHVREAKHISVGKNTRVRYGSSLLCYSSYHQQRLIPSLRIGNNVYINTGFKAIIATDLIIEDDVTIANDVSVITENHGLQADTASYLDNDLSVSSVTIRKGAWIGEKAILLPGVTVGEKSIIGAGSVVTKSIPAYSLAVGNPARVIKHFNTETKKWEKVG